MAGKLTTHALDTAAGIAAAGMAVTVRRDGVVLTRTALDAGGRAVLLEAGLEPGAYDLVFAVAAYHRARGVALADPPFLDEVTVRFGVSDPDAHYHVPLLVSPYSYATYRGG